MYLDLFILVHRELFIRFGFLGPEACGILVPHLLHWKGILNHWADREVSTLVEKEMATHSSILACRIPWTEELGRLQSMGWQRVGH